MSSVDDGRAQLLVHSLCSILGRTQEQLAGELGVSFTTVNAWACGRRRPRKKSVSALEALLPQIDGEASGTRHDFLAAVAHLHVLHGAPALRTQSDPLDELFYLLLSLKSSKQAAETFDRLAGAFRPWSRLLQVSSEDIQSHIRRGGLGSLKARAFVDIASRLQEDFGEVSLDAVGEMEPGEAESYLMSLPGVGRKTARCVQMYSFRHDLVPVDVHTYRVGVRLGLVPTCRDTNAGHSAFDAATPEGLAYPLHTNFVAHGKAICLESTPKCGECPLSNMCRERLQRSSAEEPTRRNVELPSEAISPEGRPRAVDLYAGCGGLSYGLEAAGFDVGYALDWDQHACDTHRHNMPKTKVACTDVRKVAGADILQQVGGPVALVAGGPNCQGVSERGLRNPDDPRNFMFPEFVRLVREMDAPSFLMENVPGLAHRHNFGILRKIFAAFEDLGYRCSAEVLLAADYGVPQLRYRFFMIGTRTDADLTFPEPTHSFAPNGDLFARPYVTVADAIMDLPSIDARRQVDEPIQYSRQASTAYERAMRAVSGDLVQNHICSATSELNLRRASCVREGGNWKDISPELLPDRFFACRMTDHSTTYARLQRDNPAFTITALFGNITSGAFTHPLDNRALSIREGARLQSFPDHFVFRGPRNKQYRQIGNAVPPLLAQAVSSHFLKVLRGERVRGRVPRITPQVMADLRGGDALPVLTPRFKKTFGKATRWPAGWGAEPDDWSSKLGSNYQLREEFWPSHVTVRPRRNATGRGATKG